MAQWKKINSPSSQDLYNVQMLKNTVYAVGNSSVVLKSKDTGKSWQKLSLPTLYNLRALYFFDSLSGIVTGENARMLKTVNGGITWTQQFVKTAAYANALYFEKQNGVAVGNNFLAISSNDSGKSWTEDTTQLKFIKLRSVTIMPNGKCWAVGDSGYLLHKMVNSKRWTVSKLQTNIHLTHIVNIGNQTLIITGSMPDTVNAGAYLNLMAISNDSGKTWQQNAISEMRLINGASFSHADSGYLVGSSGLISKCNNGFSNRGLQLTGIASAFNSISVYFNWGVIVGDGGTILRTSNSGGKPLLSIASISFHEPLAIFPNPSNGHFMVSSNSSKIKLDVVNMLGQVVLSFPAYEDSFEVNLESIGLHTLRVQTATGEVFNCKINIVK
ncbi:MAG: YCF48-related protein [bacterium]|nr:YCF48-related protein [bacterium]